MLVHKEAGYSPVGPPIVGNDEFAKKCIIKNPEVLRFTEEEGNLTIEASEVKFTERILSPVIVFPSIGVNIIQNVEKFCVLTIVM